MHLLQLRGVSKRFGGLQAVRDVAMTVEEGSMVGLIGPNGAGKTTLFNLIAGYYKPDEGTIQFLDRQIGGLTPHRICASGIARTFQTTKPFMESTVLDNVVVGALVQNHNVRIARQLASSIIERLQLESLADAYGHELTVPDRKRLEVARALATGARLLLLDEPMAGLNPTEKGHTVEMIHKINADGVSIIIVEHDIKSIMRLCAHIVLLNRGEVLVEGPPDTVMNDPRAIAAYLGDEYVSA